MGVHRSGPVGVVQTAPYLSRKMTSGGVLCFA